jgi:5-bromo-4-chloroindolyl phosphate hydrolysis protein
MAFDIWRSVLISFGKEAYIFGWIPNAVDLTTKQIKFNTVSQKNYLVFMTLVSTTVTLKG